MKCSKCGSENRERAKFCNECGAKLEPACPKCGTKNRPESKFCDECGEPLASPAESGPLRSILIDPIAKLQRYLPHGLAEKILSQRDKIEGERKQVTVMFCDLAGYTPLTERLGPEKRSGSWTRSTSC
jgi:predicted amidophosphoribosyltransferase